MTNEQHENVILNALSVSAERFDEHVKELSDPLHARLREQFERQAREARATMALIENGALVVTGARNVIRRAA